jgi:uncharacterized protein
MSLQFEWDDAKARQNLAKHKISFEEAETVFADPFLITYPDDIHSTYEDRFISIGQSIRGRVLLVIHTDQDDRIRIISSRKATAAEKDVYDQEF